jgi:hypothetical protein
VIPILDIGLVEELRRGRVRIVAAVERFEDGSAVLADGTCVEIDAVIAAAGFRTGLEPIVAHLGVLNAASHWYTALRSIHERRASFRRLSAHARRHVPAYRDPGEAARASRRSKPCTRGCANTSSGIDLNSSGSIGSGGTAAAAARRIGTAASGSLPLAALVLAGCAAALCRRRHPRAQPVPQSAYSSQGWWLVAAKTVGFGPIRDTSARGAGLFRGCDAHRSTGAGRSAASTRSIEDA